MKPLAVYLDRNCISIAKLARESGLPATSIYQYTSGRGDVMNMGIGAFMKLAHALGMTADEFAEELQAIEREKQQLYSTIDLRDEQ